jgi:hypothetical protein
MQEPATPDVRMIDAAPKEPEAQLGPVFVPIVLSMDEAAHPPLLDEWLARQPVRKSSVIHQNSCLRLECTMAFPFQMLML